MRNSVRATSAVSVSLSELQRPLDFASRYKLIPQSFDVREMLAPGYPLAATGSPA